MHSQAKAVYRGCSIDAMAKHFSATKLAHYTGCYMYILLKKDEIPKRLHGLGYAYRIH